MPWSKLYKEVWQKEGAAGIKRLRDSCGGNFTKLMRGASGKKLNRTGCRVRLQALLQRWAVCTG